MGDDLAREWGDDDTNEQDDHDPWAVDVDNATVEQDRELVHFWDELSEGVDESNKIWLKSIMENVTKSPGVIPDEEIFNDFQNWLSANVEHSREKAEALLTRKVDELCNDEKFTTVCENHSEIMKIARRYGSASVQGQYVQNKGRLVQNRVKTNGELDLVSRKKGKQDPSAYWSRDEDFLDRLLFKNAFQYRRVQLVKLLLNKGTYKKSWEVFKKDWIRSLSYRDQIDPLRVAVEKGWHEMVKTLMSTKGVRSGDFYFDFDNTNEDDETPLYIACEKGHLKVVKYLLSKDNPQIKKVKKVIKTKGKADKTPLEIALEKAHTEIVDFLKSRENFWQRWMRTRAARKKGGGRKSRSKKRKTKHTKSKKKRTKRNKRKKKRTKRRTKRGS